MLGKLFVGLQYLLPHHLLTAIMFKLTRSETKWWKNAFIKNFAKAYKIDMADYGNKTAEDFKSINEFFTRPLIDGARDIESDTRKLASPVDGTLSQSGRINNGRIIQAKGQDYSARQLLGDAKWGREYLNGNFCTIYLAPYNYHRIHMPCDGKLTRMRYVPGKLFSVNLTTADHVEALFAKNERVVCEFETEHGKLIIVLVGALFVGSIETVWAGQITPAKPRTGFDEDYSDQDITLKRGEEMGRFNMGSTVVMLTDNENINFQSTQETVVLGQAISTMKDTE